MIEGPQRRGSRQILAQARRHVARALWAVLGLVPRRSCGSVDGVDGIVTATPQIVGWAYRRRDPVDAVVVLVDGRAATIATFGEHRPDVASARSSDAFRGWTAQVDLRGMTDRPVVISALVLTRAGLVERLNDVVLFSDRTDRREAGEGAVECGWSTRSGSPRLVPATVVRLDGWAIPPTVPARIEISVDGDPAGLARPLVAALHVPATSSGVPWKSLAGFEFELDLSSREPGEHVRADAVVTARDGSTIPLPPLDLQVTEPVSGSDVTAEVAALRRKLDAVARQPSSNAPGLVRLLVVTHQLDLGGGQLYALELLRHLLRELDIACLVISMTDGVLRAALEELGAVVHVCGRPSVASPEHYESELLELATLVHEHGCNVAFVNSMSSGFGADLTSRLGIPTVWAVHESFSLAGFFVAAYGQDGIHPYVRRRVMDALALSAAVVFEADATRELYEVNGDPHRFVTVPYGIPIAEIDVYRNRSDRTVLRSTRNFEADDIVVLCMGTYEPRKSQGALAVAFAEIADEFPNAVLALVGEVENPYARAVREVVESLDLGDRVRLVPVVEDTYAWYAIADVFVTVSDVESLPRSVLEAMAFGVPVLATGVFGLPELIDDGVNGLLIGPRDVSELVDGLRRMLAATPEERAGLGAAGSALVRSRYDSIHYALAYRRLLRGLLDDARAMPGDLLQS